MYEYSDKNSWNKIAGLVFVVAIHGVLFYAAMSYKLIPPPQEAVTLFVNLINPPPPKKEEPPPEPPKPAPPKKVTLMKEKPVVRPQPAPVLVAEAPVVLAAEPVAPPPPPQPVIEAPPEPLVEIPAKPAAPVQLSELSLGCPQRTPPDYPAVSRRLGEQGQVKLKVELDETGRVTSARVVESSGYKRLDEAGLAAVKNWRCNAATRDGKAVRAVALQPFDFILN
ncbi:MAG: TonB family protein [Methylotenera sp.]|nr:TonB family protein [Methylotenera sp.]